MIIIAFLFKLHRFKHRAMRYMAYGAIAGFIMTAVIPMFMFYNRFYTKIQITPEYMKTFVVNVVEGFLNNLLIFGIGIGVAAVLIIGLIVLVKRNYEKKSKTHDSLM